MKLQDYRIEEAAPRHLEELPRIEVAAASRLRGYDVPASLFTDATPSAVLAEAQASGRLWVALDPRGGCVGFALAEQSGTRLHLAEVDVLPEHGRLGLGRALVRQVERWGADRGCTEVTLTTYRDVPWNGPLYRRLGYEVVPPEALDAGLVARLESEAARGLDSMPRVAMRKVLGPPLLPPRLRRAPPSAP